ncbi:MAG: hypothetical protein RLZZ115_866, partial [Cyanobacteriota bacterium]
MVRLLVKSALPKGLSFLMPMAIAGIALLDKEAIIAAKQEKEREAARLGLLKKFPTLGYGNLVAGWTFLNFLQYFGDNLAREQTDYELLDNYFEVIVAHDP